LAEDRGDGIHVDFQDMPIWKDREDFIKIFRIE